MKKSEILTQINEIVKSYMNSGWQLYWGNASYGYEFMVELVQGSEKIRVYAKNEYNTYNAYNAERIRTLEIKVVNMELDRDFEEKDQPAILHKVFFEISDDWFTYDINEAIEAKHKHFVRYKNDNTNIHEKELSASNCFIDKIISIHAPLKVATPAGVSAAAKEVTKNL